tara:strand:- start:474 stop:1094 length:621 start_codon:yes stop_codon:yes gene_type:complete
MDGSYEYKPRFRDIRIKPPKNAPDADDRVCEWPGCPSRGDARAPKGTDRLNEFHWFCQSHAAEYNKAWNFFEGMDEAQTAAFNRSAHYGHRPTWNFRSNTGPAAKAAKASKDFKEGFADPYGIFGDRASDGKAAPEPDRPRLGRLQTMALETLGVDETISKDALKKRYAELVKRFHPDANGGDRSSEEQLGRVIRAYQILKNEGFA